MRKVLVQRLQPLSMKYKKLYPLMRKTTYHFEGVFVLEEGVDGERDMMRKIYNMFGSGSFQLLAWKKYPLRERDAYTKRIVSKGKVFPLFKLALVIIDNGGNGKFIYNKMARMFKKSESPYDMPFDRTGDY